MNLITGEEASKHDATTIGIRPEHITISETAFDGAWKGTVGVSEHLGSDTFFHIQSDVSDEALTVRASGELSLSYGSEVYLTPRAEYLHRFDAQGLRID